ncbi:nitric oxide reductase transcriptional regulator NorR [Bacterioplanoides sp.]|uniref:nitric oxide reductase transcriptional regulator NorR n=1 Tax=Bacterioplanoides sp. TaxID=2066072 RepID=UPI003B5BC55C
MSPISLNALIELAIDLSHSLVNDDRFERLLTHIRKAINCDAVVLLTLQGEFLKPLAQQGLTTEVLGRRFEIQQHPRFIEICQAKTPLRFDSESELPDPYDGLLLAMEGDLPVHSCMGLPLLFEGNLIGVLTLDSLTPNEFDDIPARTLDIISAISAAALKNALTLELYQRDASHARAVVEELTQEALTKDGGELIGDSEAMSRLKQEIQIVAGSDFTALIQGETGVGKELVARTIHQQSNRNNGPLVYVNCAALPENLIESELFGHVKGAFTGASQNRSGKFTIANGGTLFLDEIGEIPLQVQSKLLRALQSQEIQPVGQDKTHKVDVRIIAATNRDLQQEAENGDFRADLYHRLSVYPLTVPPLRQRKQDIVLLSGYFVELMRRKLGLQQIKFAAEVIPYLNRYDWPGNIRELEHCINRAALKARSRSAVNEAIIAINRNDIGLLQTDHELPTSSDSYSNQTTAPDATNPTVVSPRTREPVNNLKQATEQFQRQCILQALESSNGNWAAAARQLDMDRANLSRLAKRLDIQVVRSIKG